MVGKLNLRYFIISTRRESCLIKHRICKICQNSLTRIFPLEGRIFDFALIPENTAQCKLVFCHILRSLSSGNQIITLVRGLGFLPSKSLLWYSFSYWYKKIHLQVIKILCPNFGELLRKIISFNINTNKHSLGAVSL